MKKLALLVAILSIVVLCSLSFIFAQSFFKMECPECHGTGKVIVKCNYCNGTGKVKHTLTYQILDYYEEKINAIEGVYFKIHIKIKNTDKYGGYFSIKETVIIGGHESFQTKSVYLPSEQATELIFPDSGWYYAGFSTYSHNYAVTPSQVFITCPKCNGSGTVEETCPLCKGSGQVVDWYKVWILILIELITGLIAFSLLIQKSIKRHDLSELKK